MNLSSIRVGGLLAVLAIALFGCDGKEARAVRDDYIRAMQALASGDGATAVEYMSEEQIQDSGRIVRLAISGSRRKLEDLPPMDIYWVLTLRHLFTARELEGMDGREFTEYATDNGFFRFAYWDDLGDIRVYDGYAMGELLDPWDGERTGYYLKFFYEDGRWKWSDVEATAYYDRLWKREADEMGSSVNRLIERVLELETGRALRRDIWDTPTRG